MIKDVIIILGGGINSDGFIPDAVKYRIDKGVELFKNKVAPYFIMSGSWEFWAEHAPPRTEAEAMKEYAISLGVLEEKILLEESSKDTTGNAYFTKINFLKPKNWKNIIVITSDYHFKKAKYIFQKVLGPEYEMDFIETQGKLSRPEFEKKIQREQKVLSLLKQWMSQIKDGDDTEIKNLLYTKHPGYAEKPEISKEQLLKMIERGD